MTGPATPIGGSTGASRDTMLISYQRARIAELERMLSAALGMQPPTIVVRPAAGFTVEPSPVSVPVVAIRLLIDRPELDRIEVRQYLSEQLYQSARWTIVHALDDACRHAERALGVERNELRRPW